MKRNIIKILTSLLTIAMILTAGGINSYAESINGYDDSKIPLPEKDSSYTVYEIKSEEDLIKLSDMCAVDYASEKLYVELKTDLTLTSSYKPIPYFMGIFEGNGHTISNVLYINSSEPVGLFSTIGNGALVKNLNVEGNIQPTDNANYIGAIAGENQGIIYNCSFSGVVTGDQYVGGITGTNALTGIIANSNVTGAVRGSVMTGGITGVNNGTILRCESRALINTENSDSGIDIANLDITFTLDLAKLSSFGSTSLQDIGGIAGYSSGIIAASVNYGEVGYTHTGYNIGGIVGRSSGHILKCTNYGHVTGRKDVGGILGQMEPYVQKTISQSQLAILNTQLSEMQDLCEKAQNDASDASDVVNNRVSKINEHVSNAEDSASKLTKDSFDKSNINEDLGNINVNETVESAKDYIKDNAYSDKDKIKDSIEEKAKESDNLKTEEELYDSLKEINTQISLLNKESKNYSDQLNADIKEINSKYSEIQTTLENLKEVDYSVDDTSTVDTDLIIHGAVRKCINEGLIEGDLSAGGIAGVMGEESTVDPEDEISLKLDTDTYTSYEYKAVMDGCINRGHIYTKRNYSGGLTGRAEIGYIKDSENYGNIVSDGSYVGGVAASSSITVRNCYVKATLSGLKHVGGIIGEGVSDSGDGKGSLVSDCRSLVSIENASKFYGAIAGSPDGEYDNNIFTAKGLMGLGAYSKDKGASPVPYAELITGNDVPTEFTRLLVKFVAEDTVIKEFEAGYGSSVTVADYPDIPHKKNCYAVWDKPEIEAVTIDTVVNALYYQYISALTSEQTRATDRPVFYVEGDFSDTQELTVAGSIANFYTVTSNGRNKIEDLFYTKQKDEQWTITIPDDRQETHTLRYLPSDISSHAPEIHVYENGEWKLAEAYELGSYYAFSATGNNIDVAVVLVEPVYTAFVIMIVAIIVALVLIILLISSIKRITKKKSGKHQKQDDKETDDTSGDTKETSVKEADIKEPDSSNSKPKKKAGRIILRIINAILFVAVVITTVYLAKNPEIVSSKITYFLAIRTIEEKELQYDVNLSVSVKNNTSNATAYVWSTDADNNKITCIESEGVSLYKCQDRVYLENGTAFELSEIIPNYENVFPTLLTALKNSDISSEKTDGGTTHTITINSNDAVTMLNNLLGGYAEHIGTENTVNIILYSSNWKIDKVEIKGSTVNELNQKVSFDCIMNLIHKEDAKETNVPKAVLSSINDNVTGAVITDDLVKLLYSFGKFSLRDPAVCDIKLTADGGVFTLSDNLSWFRTKTKNEWINCVTKNGVSLYYSENGACTAKGVSLTDAQKATVDTAGLFELAYNMCISGNIETKHLRNEVIYTLKLSDDEMASLVTLFAPEITAADKVLKEGSIEIIVNDDGIKEMTINISGKANLVLISRAFSLTAVITPTEENPTVDYTIPTTVVDTLTAK